jgi:8-oxo-dGTP pyrophosphatase MutT (NUDIX family)
MNYSGMIPTDAERGAGLILQSGGRYLFFLAGSRYHDEGSTFFAGIGGHLEAGETWLDCLQREAIEEIGAPVRVLDSERFYHITPDDRVLRAPGGAFDSRPRPLALLEITIPSDAPWNKSRQAHPYCVLVYRGCLETDWLPTPADVDGLLRLPAGLVLESLNNQLTLDELLTRGAELLEKTPTPRGMVVYPFGSARAMALLMQAGEPF